MKAVLWTAYGPAEVLKVREIPVPTPKDNEVLVRIRATTVSPGDCEIRSFTVPVGYIIPARLIFGIRRPKEGKILGQELAGEVASYVKTTAAGDGST